MAFSKARRPVRRLTKLSVKRTFVADASAPTLVKLVEPSRSVRSVMVAGSEVTLERRLTVHRPDGDGTLAIDITLPAAARSSAPFVVEFKSGARRYREALPATGKVQLLRFNLFYGEPEPDLFNCPRHGLVRPRNGACPELPPHTKI